MDEEQKQPNAEVGEDVTQYGEFISTYFSWLPLPNQKERAEKMVKMTKNNNKENCDKCHKEE